jgi:hypothetical protein
MRRAAYAAPLKNAPGRPINRAAALGANWRPRWFARQILEYIRTLVGDWRRLPRMTCFENLPL